MAEFRLDEVCSSVVDCEHKTVPEVLYGSAWAVGTAAMSDGRIDFSRAKRISDETYDLWTRRAVPCEGDLILAREAPVGPVVRVPASPRVALGQRTVLLRPRQDVIDSRYLHFLLMSSEMQHLMHSKSEGSTVRHLNVEDVRALPLPPLPALLEQRAIADVLGALDDKIESNRRLQLLLDAVIEAEFARATNGSNLVHFGHSLAVVMGAPFGGDHFGGIGHGRPLIRIRDLKTFAPQTWTTESRADEVLVRAGDVVVGMDAEFRSTLWVGEVGLLNQRVCKFVPKAGVATAFAWYAIRSDLEYCERAKSGTTVIHLNKGDIDRFSVPELSPGEHQGFLDLTEPMLNRLVSAGLENLRLAALRDALLPELLSGRVRVMDAESMMENV